MTRMTKVNNKGFRKVFWLALAVFTLAVFAQPAAADAKSPVGIVNYQLIFNQHPDRIRAQESLNIFAQQLQANFNSQAPNLTEQGRQAYLQQSQQAFEQRKAQLANLVQQKVMAAIKEVANAKGFSVVLDSRNVLYGGEDITNDVLQKIKAQQ